MIKRIVIIVTMLIGFGLFGVDTLASDMKNVNMSINSEQDSWVIKNDGEEDLNIRLKSNESSDEKLIEIKPGEDYRIYKGRKPITFKLYNDNKLIYLDTKGGFGTYSLIFFVVLLFFGIVFISLAFTFNL